MKNRSITPMNLQLFAEGDPAPAPEAQPTPQPAAPTPPQAVTVDMEAINKAAEARAERAAQAVVKDMLTKQGLDDEAIKGVLAEWKSKQSTPEMELKQRDDTIGQLQQQLEAERQEKIALSKGVPLGAEDEATKEKANACMSLAKTYVTESVPFEAALDKALAIISFEKKQEVGGVPRFDSGGGKDPITPSEADAIKAEYQAAVKNKDGAKMSFLIRKAQEKKIQF